MNRSTYLLFFFLGLLVPLIVLALPAVPQYMDADYYSAGAFSLAQGRGFSEMFLWNYLDDPAGLPHPSHAYWMPLASLVAALGSKIAPFLPTLTAARLGFLLVAASVAPLTVALAHSLTARPHIARLAGALALLPAFYAPYLPATDTFGLYMALGALFFLLLAPQGWVGAGHWRWLAVGLLAGLFHLARADGGLWLLIALIAAYSHPMSSGAQPAPRRRLYTRLASLSLVLLGYLLVLGPWMARNLAAYGTLLAPGGARSLWLTDYDELFSYPASLLTPGRWWGSGLPAILSARGWALGINLQTALAVQGMIFLTPLIVWGAWRLRRDFRLRLGTLAWLLTLGVMTLPFPFSGARGGFFHSGAALQPLFLVLAPLGLDQFIDWGARRRGWRPQQARPVFAAGLLLLALGLTATMLFQRATGTDPANALSAPRPDYARLERALQDAGASPDQVVLVGNPPAYYLASQRPAIVIPNGDIDTLFAVAHRYRAGYLLLNADHPALLDQLYHSPTDTPGLLLLETLQGTRIFKLVLNQP